MDWLKNAITKVGTGLSSVTGLVVNPIQTVTGFAQGLVRPRTGAPFLQGANTAVQTTIQNQQAAQSSILGKVTGAVGGFLSGTASNVSTGVKSVIDTISGSVAKVQGQAKAASVADRVLDIGLNGLDSLVQRLAGGGSTESPNKPISVSTGTALPNPFDQAQFAYAQPIIVPGASSIQGNPQPINIGISDSPGGAPGGTTTILDPGQPQGISMTPILLGLAGIGAIYFLTRKGRR